MYEPHMNRCPGPCCAEEGARVEPPARLEPQVEHLVTFAHHNGYLIATNRQLHNDIRQEQRISQVARENLQKTKRQLEYAEEEMEEIAKERDSALRKVPKKKVIKKKGKK